MLRRYAVEDVPTRAAGRADRVTLPNCFFGFGLTKNLNFEQLPTRLAKITLLSHKFSHLCNGLCCIYALLLIDGSPVFDENPGLDQPRRL